MKSLKIPQQIISLSIIFALLIVIFIVARLVLIPKSFGVYGHYRADAVAEIAAQPIQYAGFVACRDCHDDVYQLKLQSNHKGLSCEICHGAAAGHAEAPDENAPVMPRERMFCPICHDYNPSRPTGFPQIISATHNPGKACIGCHDPHNPVTPHVPQDCSGCHREIANEKAVSPHESLACTRCHAVQPEHMVTPRASTPLKPSTREFCGECHASDANSPAEIPRIEFATHGGRYLCWDCHYPHHPEGQ